MLTEDNLVLSQFTRLTDEQTDGRADIGSKSSLLTELDAR